MPENLSSIMGAGFDTTPKKKLHRVDDHWEDDAGNKYADPFGMKPYDESSRPKGTHNIPNAMMGEMGKDEISPMSVMEPFGMEKSSGTAGWGVSGGTPAKDKPPDWQSTPVDQRQQKKDENSEPTPEEAWNAMTEKGRKYRFGSYEKFLQEWNQMTPAQKRAFKGNARIPSDQQPSTSIMG